MIAWTEQALRTRRPAVIFAQETFPSWLSLFDGGEYRVITGIDRGWKVQSALVCRSDMAMTKITETALPNLGYHGTYVVAAEWSNNRGGSPAILASVHASPNKAEPERYGWPTDAGSPQVRDPGTDRRWATGLWDSDYLLLTIHNLHKKLRMPVLAAGDLNESLLDDPVGGTWARTFFDQAAEYGLKSWLHDCWTDERPTRGGVQLDHVLATEDAIPLLAADPPPEIDARWTNVEQLPALSDHAPIWFALIGPGS